MGEIFKARDPRLNRTVAIKALSIEGMGDPDRRRRFIQEAQAASGLNHPNIITIHDIISDSENEYMVMEYVSGKTLSELIQAGGVGVEKTLRYGVQIADALAAAHAAGIVHRDLKPGNVMVTESGLVKILDFGLAKVSVATQLTEETQTLGAPMTVEGSILGTVSYMSPEQAQGAKVDARSDIFAFGALMYEMITGAKAFSGASPIATLTAILRDEVKPIRDSVPDCPPELEEIIGRALRKAPGDRWQSMQEVHGVLAGLRQKFESGILYGANVVPVKKSARTLMLGLIAFLFVFGLGGWFILIRRTQTIARPPAQVVVQPAPVAVAPPVVPDDKPSPLAEAPKVEEPPKPAEPVKPAATPRRDGALTNQGVIELAAAKLPDAVIIGQIRGSKTRFDLSNAGVIALSKGGVSPAVIEVMRHPEAAPTPLPVLPPAALPVPVSEAAPSKLALAPVTAPGAVQRVAVVGGAAFEIVLMDDIPAEPAAGTPLRFQVGRDVAMGNSVVLAKGAAVRGEVLEPGKKGGILRRGGKPAFRLVDAVAVDGSKLAVKASPGRSGDKNEHNIEPPGHKGKESLAPKGTSYLGYFDGDQTVTVKK
jgi:serine/threonine-protein kinase